VSEVTRAARAAKVQLLLLDETELGGASESTHRLRERWGVRCEPEQHPETFDVHAERTHFVLLPHPEPILCVAMQPNRA
jgi:hypothetical protein